MIIFNALLISMALLSLQQKEMETRVLTLRQRRVLVEERMSTEEITRTRVVTIVVTPLPSAGP
jgi:energy-converting hydrogenase Eha subunit H